MDHSPTGSSVHGILQERILELIAISFSRVSYQPRDRIRVSCVSYIGRWILYHWVTWDIHGYTHTHTYTDTYTHRVMHLYGVYIHTHTHTHTHTIYIASTWANWQNKVLHPLNQIRIAVFFFFFCQKQRLISTESSNKLVNKWLNVQHLSSQF